jgi:1-deoxy-D-xylulose-5-phosphate reductoisomerase
MGDKLKGLVILGSTGSIGVQTLDVIKSQGDHFYVVGLGAGFNVELIERQLAEWKPKLFSCQSPEAAMYLSAKYGIQHVTQEELVSHPDASLVMAASVGAAGLKPILAAIENGKPIALANKEPLVIAGDIVTGLAKDRGVDILPVDSEPSAIWQCLRGEDKEISKVIITASGGAFRGRTFDELTDASPEEALNHPTWGMGRKITIDSATLMNKAFEVIEAHWLFGVPWENIEVVVHPQSIIHAMVEFVDGSVKAQLSTPDMRLPIQHALSYPNRIPSDYIPTFNPVSVGSLTFEELDSRNFPCFGLALEAGKKGGSYPVVVNAANEVAVQLFLDKRIKFTDIPLLINDVLSSHHQSYDLSPEEILEIDEYSRDSSFQWYRKTIR